MSNFHTRSQRNESKRKMRRNDEVMRYVSDNLKTYDAAATKDGGAIDFAAREVFAKTILESGQATIPK